MKVAKGRPTSIYLDDDVRSFLDNITGPEGLLRSMSRSELINAVVRAEMKKRRRRWRKS